MSSVSGLAHAQDQTETLRSPATSARTPLYRAGWGALRSRGAKACPDSARTRSDVCIQNPRVALSDSGSAAARGLSTARSAAARQSKMACSAVGSLAQPAQHELLSLSLTGLPWHSGGRCIEGDSRAALSAASTLHTMSTSAAGQSSEASHRQRRIRSSSTSAVQAGSWWPCVGGTRVQQHEQVLQQARQQPLEVGAQVLGQGSCQRQQGLQGQKGVRARCTQQRVQDVALRGAMQLGLDLVCSGHCLACLACLHDAGCSCPWRWAGLCGVHGATSAESASTGARPAGRCQYPCLRSSREAAVPGGAPGGAGCG